MTQVFALNDMYILNYTKEHLIAPTDLLTDSKLLIAFMFWFIIMLVCC